MKQATYEEMQERIRIIEQQKADAERQYTALHRNLRAQAVKRAECPIKIMPQGTGTPDPIYLDAHDAKQVMELIISLTEKHIK